MKIKELIEALKKLDPDYEVRHYSASQEEWAPVESSDIEVRNDLGVIFI